MGTPVFFLGAIGGRSAPVLEKPRASERAWRYFGLGDPANAHWRGVGVFGHVVCDAAIAFGAIGVDDRGIGVVSASRPIDRMALALAAIGAVTARHPIQQTGRAKTQTACFHTDLAPWQRNTLIVSAAVTAVIVIVLLCMPPEDEPVEKTNQTTPPDALTSTEFAGIPIGTGLGVMAIVTCGILLAGKILKELEKAKLPVATAVAGSHSEPGQEETITGGEALPFAVIVPMSLSPNREPHF